MVMFDHHSTGRASWTAGAAANGRVGPDTARSGRGPLVRTCPSLLLARGTTCRPRWRAPARRPRWPLTGTCSWCRGQAIPSRTGRRGIQPRPRWPGSWRRELPQMRCSVAGSGIPSKYCSRTCRKRSGGSMEEVNLTRWPMRRSRLAVCWVFVRAGVPLTRVSRRSSCATAALPFLWPE